IRQRQARNDLPVRGRDRRTDLADERLTAPTGGFRRNGTTLGPPILRCHRRRKRTIQYSAAPSGLLDRPPKAGRHPPPEGGGPPREAGRVGVTAIPHILRRRHLRRRPHPTPDCLRQSDPPPSGEGVQHVSSV